MFHHVRQCTIAGFGNIALLAKLWSNYIIPLGYYADSVRHALISLGASHRSYLGDCPDEHEAVEAHVYNDIATRQYAIATRHAARDLQNLDSTTIRTSLVCCLIFVCCEIMQGHYDKALFHLRSGCKMLTSLEEAATQMQTTAMTTRQKCMAETVSRYFDQLCDIADMLSCLAFDAAFLMEEDAVIPDLSFFFRGNPETDPSQPFTTAAEARYDAHRMERAFGSALGFTFRGTFRPAISWSSFLDIPEEPSPTEDDYLEEWAEARRLFKGWSSRLDLYIKNVRSNPSATKDELWEAQFLSFIQKDWTMYIQHCERDLEMSGQDTFKELLEEAEALVLAYASMQKPSFTLAADVIPRIVFIAAFAGDAGLQRRAVDLLFSMRRKEGLWDSREIASVLESILIARECDLWDREFEKVSLPRLAGMLVSLKLCDEARPLPLATLIK
ncbi:C6 zinc finger domain protein [Colletotrichum musicola]|uniref:C6 zinc finger domain protein n=1 Tax=Colletotrichum musicola TaxID=2175873 RepID=A0A8H6NKW0_9PEZI|nr:C6 zinc finger domain protein [Colletotrichum musicola]